MVKITKEHIEHGMSDRNGWSYKQIRLLGENPKLKGWKHRLVGKIIDSETLKRFLDLRNVHLKNKKPRKKTPWNKPVDVAGALSRADQYLHPNWQKLRLEVLKRDRFKCRICQDDQTTLHVHHKKYIGKYVWDTPKKHLMTLCKKCHAKKHNK